MRATVIQRAGGLALAALLPLLPAVPAAAATEPPVEVRFELALASASSTPEPDLGLSPEPQTRGKAPAGEIRMSELSARAWAIDEQDTAPPGATQGEQKRGFGRWLKKRWWVPVLAGAALAFALDDGDDDRSGEED